MFEFLWALIPPLNLHSSAGIPVTTKASSWKLAQLWLSSLHAFFTKGSLLGKWMGGKHSKNTSAEKPIYLFAEHRSFPIMSFKSGTRRAWLAQLTGHVVPTDMPTLGGNSRSIGRLVAHLGGRYNSTTDMLRVLIAQRKGSFFCQTGLNGGALFPFLSLFLLPDISPLSSSVLLVETLRIPQGPA